MAFPFFMLAIFLCFLRYRRQLEDKEKQGEQMKQLELFTDIPEIRLQRAYDSLKDSVERSRKSQYAKISSLEKKYNDAMHELETLKAAICKYKPNLEPWLFQNEH